jgi:uncharacterized membrane protein YdbT with pleckstrin-like domain
MWKWAGCGVALGTVMGALRTTDPWDSLDGVVGNLSFIIGQAVVVSVLAALAAWITGGKGR